MNAEMDSQLLIYQGGDFLAQIPPAGGPRPKHTAKVVTKESGSDIMAPRKALSSTSERLASNHRRSEVSSRSVLEQPASSVPGGQRAVAANSDRI